MKTVLSLFLMFYFSNVYCQAVDDYRTRASNNWNANATWERYDGTTWVAVNGVAPNTIPNSGDGVIAILNTHTVTVTANVTIDQTTINSGGQITINTGITLTIANGAGTDLTVDGILDNTGTLTTTGTVTFNASSSYLHSRNGGTIPTATWNTSSTCTISGVTGTTPSGLGQSFGNFTWNCTGQTSDRNFNGSLTIVNGDFRIVSTGTGGDVLRLTNGTNLTLNIGRDFLIEGGNLLFTNNNADVTVNVTRDFIQSGGSLDFSDDNQIGVLVLNVTRNFSQSAGSFDFASGDANTARTPALTVGGDFSQTGSGTITTSTGDADITNGTITFNKSGTQTFSIATQANLDYINIIVASGSTLQLNSDLTVRSSSTNNWAGNFTVNSGGIFNASTYHLFSTTGTSTGTNNDFVLSSGATVITAEDDGLEDLNTGSISTSIANRTYSSGANYTFRGALTGTFTTTATANTASNITIDRSGGVTLEQAMAVTSSFTLTSGILTTTATNLLTVNAGATSSAGTSTEYVNGPMAKVGTTAFTFPVGKTVTGGGLRTIAIAAPSASTTFRAEFFRANPNTAIGATLGTGIAKISACEYWVLDRTAGTANVAVTLSWSLSSPCGIGGYIQNTTALRVARWTGTGSTPNNTWVDQGQASSTGNNSAGTITSNTVSNFSPFTIGSADNSNALPINFANVLAKQINSGVEISWSNLTESELNYYEVERSSDGRNFTSIARVQPKANDYSKQDYSFTDLAPLAINYYRIKAVELNSSSKNSIILKVSKSSSTKAFIVYPNPVQNKVLAIQSGSVAAGAYFVQLIRLNGQQVFAKTLNLQSGVVSQSLELPANIQAGIYLLRIEGAGTKSITKVFVQ